MEHIKIPVWVAVLINVNIVIGSAFFLNASHINYQSGILAPFAWILCGLLLLPLVIVLANLSKHHPSAGGLYAYSFRQLGPVWGVISGWGYFIGTIAANAAVIHAFSKKIQKIDYAHQFFANNTWMSGLSFDVMLIITFTLFNLLNVKFLEGFQIALTVLKAIPLLLIICALPLLFDVKNLMTAKLDLTGLLETIPLVLFAYIGIEACCAITDKIKDGKKNASRVIFISFAIVMSIYAILQLSILCIHGTANTNPFLAILPALTNNQTVITWGNNIIYFAILSSFLGGFYGMFYYNNWNLFAIAQDNHIVGSKKLTQLTRNQVPWACVLTQSFLTILFLIIVQKKAYLIAMSDFGTVIAYLLSTVAFLTITKTWAGFFALASCTLLILLCAKNLITSGIHYLIPFLVILLAGLVAHKINEYYKKYEN